MFRWIDLYNARGIRRTMGSRQRPYGIHKVIQGAWASQFRWANSRVWLKTEGLSSIKGPFSWAMGNTITLEDAMATERS